MKKFRADAAVLGLMMMFTGCLPSHLPGIPGYSRPPELAGEWVDVSKTTAADTSIWILRGDGYDGVIHLRRSVANGTERTERNESRYGSWYLDGALADSARRALCFSRRIGRFGASCFTFSLRTWPESAGVSHLVIHGYRGEHSTSDRELVRHAPDPSR